jgi:hypothetical protein
MTVKETKEFIILQEDVGHIKKDIKEIKTNSSELNKSMTKITSKLFKDDATGEEGFFEITHRNNIKLASVEKRFTIALGIVSGVCLYIGYIFKALKG